MTEDDDSGPDWEEQMLSKLSEMFKQMGLSVDVPALKDMMGKFQEKFEQMGLDPEKIAKGGINLNFDLSNLNKMLSGGGDLNDILSNLGFNVEVDAKPAEIEVPDDDDDDDIHEVKQLPAADIFLDGWEMSVTVDCTMQVELSEDIIELELIEKGSLLEVMKSTQAHPVARIELPHRCEKLVGWSFNNGILDVTLKLIPQGSALDDSEEDEDDVGDEEKFEIPDINIDLSDDDEDDDGGIPIS